MLEGNVLNDEAWGQRALQLLQCPNDSDQLKQQ
jgi:hypothetical protein